MLNIKRAREVVVLCTDLDLKAEHTRAVAEMERINREVKRDPREVDTRLRDAAAAVVDVEQRMAGSEVEFVLEALPRKVWAEFVEANPPREGNETDKTFGLNISKLDEPIAASIVEVRARLAGDPVEFDRDAWVQLADDISDAQWQDFATTTLRLNNGARAVPFSPAASNVMRRSELTSKPQSD